MSLMPIGSGSPRCTGAPCTEGNREVICIARIASAGFIGRIDTTIGPWNTPAGTHGMLVRYIGTLQLQAMWRTSMPSSSSASSNENEQPMREAHQVVAPDMADVVRFLDQFAVAPDAIAWHVGADIKILAESREMRIDPASDTASTGQGFGLAWANRRKSCASARQDDQVGLHIAGREA